MAKNSEQRKLNKKLKKAGLGAKYWLHGFDSAEERDRAKNKFLEK